jgi:hypothetical protein
LNITTIPSPPAPFSSLTTHFAAYVVSPTEAFWIQTDVRGTNQIMVSGEVLKQSSSAYTLASLQGASVFSVVGVRFGSSTPSASVSVGEITFDNTGTVTQGIFDQNEGGTLNSQIPIGGNFVLDASFKGRATFNFCPGAGCNSTNAKPQILSLVGQNRAFILEGTATTPGDEVTFGFLEPQTGGPFTEASVAGSYAAGTATPAVSAVTNNCGTVKLTSGAPSTFSGLQDFSAPPTALLSSGVAVAGNYTLSNVSSSTGRFTANSTQPSAVSFVLYTVSQTKFLIVSMVNGDIEAQIAVFEQ